jgi:hypothetical protein
VLFGKKNALLYPSIHGSAGFKKKLEHEDFIKQTQRTRWLLVIITNACSETDSVQTR